MYEVYATKDQLAEYLGIELASLPADSDRLLQRASEMVFQLVSDNYDPLIADHVEAVQLATCAQVEQWGQLGELQAIAGSVNDFSLGPLKINFSKASGGSGSISPRSYGYLSNAGLLYARRRIGRRISNDSGEYL